MTVLIDGNMLFYRAYESSKKYGNPEYSFRENVLRKFIYDIVQAQNLVKSGNDTKAILFLDSKSWRKTAFVEYKANRDHSEIDYTIFDDCIEFVKVNDICLTIKVKEAESDDLFAVWVKEKIGREKEGVIIYSSDGDLKQLLSNNPYCVMYSEIPVNGQEVLYVKKGFFESEPQKEETVEDEETKSYSNFFGVGTKKGNEGNLTDFERIIRLSKENPNRVIKEVDCNYQLWEKVLTGDKGDNLPAIWKATKGRKKLIKDAHLEQVLALLGNETPHEIYHEQRIGELIDVVERVFEQSVLDRIGFAENFKRNYQLIVLDTRNFPPSMLYEAESFYGKEVISRKFRTVEQLFKDREPEKVTSNTEILLEEVVSNFVAFNAEENLNEVLISGGEGGIANDIPEVSSSFFDNIPDLGDILEGLFD